MSEDQQPSLRQIIRALEALEETHTERVQSVRDEYVEYANQERRQRQTADRLLLKRDIHVDVLKEQIEILCTMVNDGRQQLKRDLNNCVTSEPHDILRLLGKHDLVFSEVTWEAWLTTKRRFGAELAKDGDLGQETHAEVLHDRVRELEQGMQRIRSTVNKGIDGDKLATALIGIADIANASLDRRPEPEPQCASCGDVPDHSEAACTGTHPADEIAMELEQELETARSVIETLRAEALKDQAAGEMMAPQHVLDLLKTPQERAVDLTESENRDRSLPAYPGQRCARQGCGGTFDDHVGFVLGHLWDATNTTPMPNTAEEDQS